MPPKKQDKKAPAAQAEEDLSDLSSLPHIKIFTMWTAYHFYYQKSKEEVKEMVDKILNEEGIADKEELKHVKTITRDSIIEAIKGITYYWLPLYFSTH